MKIRFKYEKNEPVKYVGHLDVMAMFDRVFRRSNIKVQFSQGFTQRSQIIFALPTSVGIISKCELFEVEIPDANASDIPKIVEKLNSNLPNGFIIKEAYEVNDSTSIMSKVESAQYIINVKLDEENISKVQELFKQDKIFVKRVAKNNMEYDMNITPYVLELEITPVDKGVDICAKLKSGSKENLKPDYIIQAITNCNIDIIDYQITKTNVIINE